MKVALHETLKQGEKPLMDAFRAGVLKMGDEVLSVSKHTMPTDAEVAVFIGVKSRKPWRRSLLAGQRTILLDRGYVRSAQYFRIAIDSHQPTWFLRNQRQPPGRWKTHFKDWRPCAWHAGPIRRALIAGSTAKYHLWYNMSEPTGYNTALVRELTARGIDVTYRPKRAWDGKQPIPGARYDGQGSIYDALPAAHLLVTHGSNACFDAMLAGVPAIVLGNGVTESISSHTLDQWPDITRAEQHEREQLCANLAWCQYNIAEFASGVAWAALRGFLDQQPKDIQHADTPLPPA